MGGKNVRVVCAIQILALFGAAGACAQVASNPPVTAAAPAGDTNTVVRRLPAPAARTNAVVHQPEDIVARVNGRELHWAALDQAAHSILKDDVESKAAVVPQGHEEEALQFYRRKAVTTFINRALLYEDACRRGITITPADRSNAVSKVEAMLQARGIPSLEAFFASSPQGKEAMRRDFEENLCSEKLLDEVVRKLVVVSEADREAFVREITAKRVEGRKKLETLRSRLLEGADFAALAKESSDHPSRQKGGDLGDFARGRMGDPALDEAAFSQPTNAIGPVVETKLGLAILQVLARTPAQPNVGDTPARPESVHARIILARVPPVLNAAEIDRVVKRRKYEESFKVLLRDLRRKAVIETIYPELK